MADEINELPTIRYIQQTVKQRLTEPISNQHSDSDTQVAVIIAMYLQSGTYKYHVATCTSLPTLASMDVSETTITDAQQVVKFFKLIWQVNKLTTKFTFPPYVNIQSSYYEGTLQQHFEVHSNIRNEVLKLLKPKQDTMLLYTPLTQLLSMAYWLVLFYQGKKHSEPTSYNQHLHGFLSDLVITFITLLSALFPQNLAVTVGQGLHDLPGMLRLSELPGEQPDYKTLCYPMKMDDLIRHIPKNIAAKLEECEWTPNENTIDTAIKLHLLNDNYKCHVAACTRIPTEGIDLKRFHKKDTKEAVDAFKKIWRKHLTGIPLPEYVAIEQIREPALQGYMKKHAAIHFQLLELLRQETSMHLYLPLVQLLSLAYWLAHYYHKITQHTNESQRKRYNEHLYRFLLDFVVSFVLLLSEAFPQSHNFSDVSNNYKPPDTTDKKVICYMQQTIELRLEVSGYTPSTNNSAQVETAITVYLLSETYKYHIAACTGLSIQAINLEHLQIKDAEEVAKTFQLIWKEILDVEEAPYYVFIPSNVNTYKKRLQLYTEKHLKIRKQLMELFKKKENFIPLYLPLVKLLSLTYWLAQYSKRSKYYGLHGFLSDFVAVFILIISEWYSPTYFFVTSSDLPGIVETVVKVKNFAENSVFRKLILKEVCQILEISVENDEIGAIALSIKEHLKKTCKIKNIHWKARDPDFLYSVIADQARYMTENNNRNTVSHKNISNIIKFSVVDVDEILQKDQQGDRQRDRQRNQQGEQQRNQQGDQNREPQEVQKRITENSQSVIEHDLHGPLNIDSLSDMADLINDFYHLAYIGIVWFTNKNCQDKIRNGWIVVDNFITYRRKKVREVIEEAETISDVRKSKQFIAQVSVAVREIITARCWLSVQYRKVDKNQKNGIVSDSEHRAHRDVLFHFIAFRVILLYLLPKKASQYGEKDIAEKLSRYAKKNSIVI